MVFTPSGGIAEDNRDRVLINLHGGGFVVGEPSAESIPIAAVGRIKVIGVDYRLAPKHKFPSASEDALSVYQALLSEYQPNKVGIYGCSAGGILTAQTIAGIRKNGLPKPGAVGMFCGAAADAASGDSPRLMGETLLGLNVSEILRPYLGETDSESPYVWPAESDDLLVEFPPSLLISSTRDFMLSSVVHTHSRLTALGVDAHLHVWEGLGHGFFIGFPQIRESKEVFSIIAGFFRDHLGSRGEQHR